MQALSFRRLQRGFDRVNLHHPTLARTAADISAVDAIDQSTPGPAAPAAADPYFRAVAVASRRVSSEGPAPAPLRRCNKLYSLM